jgi:hypothetical protein
MSLVELHDISRACGGGAAAVNALDDVDLSVEPADVSAAAAGSLRIGRSQPSAAYLRRTPARRTGRAIRPGVRLARGEARGAPAVQSAATCAGVGQSESTSGGDSPVVGPGPHRPEMNQ